MELTFNNEVIYVNLDSSGVLTYDEKVLGVFKRTTFPELLVGYTLIHSTYKPVENISTLLFRKLST